MNSMFSLFNVVCASCLSLKRERASLSCATKESNNTQVQSQEYLSNSLNLNKKQESHTSSKTRRGKPMFSLELDGLHCFETLVFYK
ncbi:hypothetical protein Pint_32121 [Pistacia integerrima]|uniref:Uncharacterized protein n=1 Tax=Pistacia integerrima TaxID=434235 RepID=A0ACC0XPW6_9ROSI|nr:hypothetical protein Pint_32121 [Pistacia integerrima]